jgi:hypothetical protein
MQNIKKLYPLKISRLADWTNFAGMTKMLCVKLLPILKPLFLSSLSLAVLLILQILTVGMFDRFGISPKVSFLISSVVLIVVSVSLAMIGGINFAETADKIVVGKLNQPICKILFIRKKGVQKI